MAIPETRTAEAPITAAAAIEIAHERRTTIEGSEEMIEIPMNRDVDDRGHNQRRGTRDPGMIGTDGREIAGVTRERRTEEQAK